MDFIRKKPKIILIAGKAESGKSSLANNLKKIYSSYNKKVILSSYSKYLKYYIEEILEEKIDEANKPRSMLQELSSKLIKTELGMPNFFIERQIQDINLYSYFADIIIISDVRFPDEITIIKEKFENVISINLVRKDYISSLTEEEIKDITEIALDNYNDYDFVCENIKDVSLELLARELVDRIGG